MDFGFSAIPALVVIAYLAAEVWKAAGGSDRIIPALVGILGGVLGIAGWKVMPGYPADDILTAVAIGIVSGLAATGVHQIGKQATKGEDDEGK